jgi:hypothetical protein
MKVTEVMFAELAVEQYSYWFNKKYGTTIKHSSEVKEGVPFVTIDFGDTSKELIFKFSFELGKIQKRLMKSGDFMLPVDEYPFPPDTKK